MVRREIDLSRLRVREIAHAQLFRASSRVSLIKEKAWIPSKANNSERERARPCQQLSYRNVLFLHSRAWRHC